MNRFALRVAGLALLGAAGVAGAASSPQTANVQVTAQVNTSCTLTSPVAADFATVDPLASGTVTTGSTGSITVNCNKGSSPALTLNNGQNFSGTRRMTNGTDFLGYTIVQPNAGFATCPAAGAGSAWSGATAVTVNVFGSNGGSQPVAICAQMTLPQVGASQGSYSDTVQVTATF